MLWVGLDYSAHFLRQWVHTDMWNTLWLRFWTPVWIHERFLFFRKTVQQLTLQALTCVICGAFLATLVRSGLRSHSSDLKSMVLYLWNILKEKFYSNNSLTEDHLKESVQYSVFSIVSAECLCVMNDVFSRSGPFLQAELNHCQRCLKYGEDKCNYNFTVLNKNAWTPTHGRMQQRRLLSCLLSRGRFLV